MTSWRLLRSIENQSFMKKNTYSVWPKPLRKPWHRQHLNTPLHQKPGSTWCMKPEKPMRSQIQNLGFRFFIRPCWAGQRALHGHIHRLVRAGKYVRPDSENLSGMIVPHLGKVSALGGPAPGCWRRPHGTFCAPSETTLRPQNNWWPCWGKLRDR